MIANLTAGQSYTAKVRTQNISTQLGQPVAAQLTVVLAAVVGSTTLISTQQSYNFAAGESHDFDFPIAVPANVSGVGVISAVLNDPSGNQLGSASLDISVVALEWGGVMFSNLRSVAYGPTGNRNQISFTVTNPSSLPVKTMLKYGVSIDPQMGIYLGVNRWTADGRLIGTYQLAPGESKQVSFIWEVSAPGSYGLWLGCGSDTVPIPQQAYGWWAQPYDTWSAFNKGRYAQVTFG